MNAGSQPGQLAAVPCLHPAPTGRRTPIPTLEELLVDLPQAERLGDPTVLISDVAYDSRAVGPGTLFFCAPGEVSDGHDFAAGAVAAGASALLVERWLEDIQVPQVRVPSVRAAMGTVAARFFGHPSQGMLMLGVTGTNGKTTTTFLLEAILREAGYAPGLIGTTGIHVNGVPEATPHTTPEAPDLHRLLRRMADQGVRGVAMEVSSHGLVQDRIEGVRFNCAGFTNLSQDHLDYHGSMEEYFAAKQRLFTTAFAERGVANADSSWGLRLVREASILMTTYGVSPSADVRALAVEADGQGIAFEVEPGLLIRSALRGDFNVENCLTAVAMARAVGIDDAAIASGIASVAGVPGRLEAVEAGQPFAVFVDYAHTPDGVENVLRAARRLTEGRVVVVLGCGGDRDRAKRPLMGEAATSLADLTFITSDNPRSEDPLAIIAEIEPGARAGGGDFHIEPDRQAAIVAAMAAAAPGDVVVLAGKGHETGQEFADGRVVPFDDVQVATAALHEVAT